MPSWADMLRYETIGGNDPRGLPGRLEPLHAPLALAGGLVRLLGAMVQRAMLPMFHSRQEFPLGRPIAFEVLRDDDPRDVS